ncbi:MAG: tRNA(Met) cytidine acetyltransferase, partial [Gammaproteobacteria bacterium]|nr:tRNA(Met) cytidine acetyltransferase [Gammaproteobacteria bacterium]
MSRLNNSLDVMQVDFDPWLSRLLQNLHGSNQRRLLSCEGDEEWCYRLYEKQFQNRYQSLLLSNSTVFSEAVPFGKVETLLGSEREIVVLDLFSGLNADVVCIAAGLVKRGGLLVFLSPGVTRWHEIKDQYGVWQDQCVANNFEFVRYFFASIENDVDACVQLRQGGGLRQPAQLADLTQTEFINGKTSEQREVLDQIDRWLTKGNMPVALLTADRGRGKSACLGFAIQNAIDKLGYSVLVTAYSRQSASIVFNHCDSSCFIAPDRLIESQICADVLVIDEAAMLPFSMLAQLCRRFKRVLMATTTGGYEGTGQGFLLRFVAHIPADQLLRLKLHEPVRWAENDCLENWVNNTFLLKAPHSGRTIAEESNAFEIEMVDRRDSSQIKKTYTLMTTAHYRTRPSDLRALMENPHLVLMAATHRDMITGMLAANCEGGLEPDLCHQIFLGNRRPRGHLLAQMLTAQAGLRDFACFKGLRIQRVAVEEVNRRRGVGKQLIKTAEAYAGEQRFDYIGACFALDSDSLGFWQNCGFSLVHIAYGQGKSTGNQTVAVVSILNPELEIAMGRLKHKLMSGLPLM